MGKANVVGAAAIGAGLMFLLDPARGKRRRAMIRDRAAAKWRRAGRVMDKAARDLGNRLRGVGAETKAMLRHEDVPDEIVTERVRSMLGRVCSHPHAINVVVTNGHLHVSGPVLESEVRRLRRAVSSVSGVRDIDDRLEVHQEAAGAPGLQGGSGRLREPRFELMQTNWSPAARLLTGATASMLLGYAFKRRGLAGAAAGMAGAILLGRSITNREISRLATVEIGRAKTAASSMPASHAPLARSAAGGGAVQSGSTGVRTIPGGEGDARSISGVATGTAGAGEMGDSD